MSEVSVIDEVLGADDETEEIETGEQEQEQEQTASPAAEETEESGQEETQEQQRITELEKINHGLMQAKTSAQARKGRIQDELINTRGTVQALRAELANAKRARQMPPPQQRQPVNKNIRVEFDDKGEAFIPAKNLPSDNNAAYKIQQLEARLNQTTRQLEQERVDQAIEAEQQSFLAEKEEYAQAQQDLKEQWDYLRTDLFDQFLASRNIPTPKSQEDALEVVSQPGFQKAFNAKYPDGNAEVVLQAAFSNGKYYQRKALDYVVGRQNQNTSAHQAIPAGKPQPLGTATGGLVEEADTLKSYADLSMEDFLRLSPEEDARMERLLQSGG